MNIPHQRDMRPQWADSPMNRRLARKMRQGKRQDDAAVLTLFEVTAQQDGGQIVGLLGHCLRSHAACQCLP
jgi:hypothetical protein